jgi:hypothetical protein
MSTVRAASSLFLDRSRGEFSLFASQQRFFVVVVCGALEGLRIVEVDLLVD